MEDEQVERVLKSKMCQLFKIAYKIKNKNEMKSSIFSLILWSYVRHKPAFSAGSSGELYFNM